MVAGIAVSAASYSIDKLYSYRIPENMTLQPGQRVQVPFGRGNVTAEGIVITVGTGPEEKLKAVESCLDEEPLLSETPLRLAAVRRERYVCTGKAGARLSRMARSGRRCCAFWPGKNGLRPRRSSCKRPGTRRKKSRLWQSLPRRLWPLP